MEGRVIGNYMIQSRLAIGGMGTVYKGTDTMLGRAVAIKVLRPELASTTAVVDRFRAEAVVLAKLNHPNIATLYSLLVEGDELFMVLEFVPGETLDSILHKRGVLRVEEAIPVFCQLLDGMDHAHELGIVHRDMKPANVMVTDKGTLKVLDFGIARLLGTSRLTRAGNVVGTLEYMAPEQVRGEETDARSDVYALGMMLYEMLTGRTPFASENDFELMRMQVHDSPAPPSTVVHSLPPLVDAAIMRAIQKDPADRFQTAGEFREMLLNAIPEGSGAVRTAGGVTNTTPKLSRDTVVRPADRQLIDLTTETPDGVADVSPSPKPRSSGVYVLLGIIVLSIAALGTFLAVRTGGDAVNTNTAEPHSTQEMPTAPVEVPDNGQSNLIKPTPKANRSGAVRSTIEPKERSNAAVQSTPLPAPSPSPTPKKESKWKKPWKIFTDH